MTIEQRSKLFRILGMIEGLTYGVTNEVVASGFIVVADDLKTLLKEDMEEAVEEDDVPLISMVGYK